MAIFNGSANDIENKNNKTGVITGEETHEEYPNCQAVKNFTDKKIDGVVSFNAFIPQIEKTGALSGKLSNNTALLGCVFKVKNNKRYIITIKGKHNRFIVSGIQGEAKEGAATTTIKQNESSVLTEFSEDFSFENPFKGTVYDYIVVNVGYNNSNLNAIVEVVESNSENYVIGGVDFLPAENVYTKTEIDKKDNKRFVTTNLFDITLATAGKTISSSTGNPADYSATDLSDFINIKTKTKYTLFNVYNFAFYDNAQRFIKFYSPSDIETNPYIVESPENAYYLRFSYKPDSKNLPQINEGIVLLPYEDGKPHLNINELRYIIPPVYNLFNLETEKQGYSVNSTNGQEAKYELANLSDFIPIEPNTNYVFSTRWTAAFYDIDKKFIEGKASSDTNLVLTSPNNAYYLRFSYKPALMIPPQVNKGTLLLPYDDGRTRIDLKYLPDILTKKYKLEYETIKYSEGLNSTPANLVLVATKTINKPPQYDSEQNKLVPSKPECEGFLFFDSEGKEMYYADSSAQNIKRLRSWDKTLANNVSCFDYLATITADGDIIFLRKWLREDPIIYPSGDYNNPHRVEINYNVGTEEKPQIIKPYGFLTSVSITQFADGSFVFGEYTKHKQEDETNGDPRCIWRVTKGENGYAPENWSVVRKFKHIYYKNVNNNTPVVNDTIGHIHTMAYDFYTDTLYCTTGDENPHCQVFKSKDRGETWVNNDANDKKDAIASGSQKYRSVGMVFTEDGCYYGTDSFYDKHALYKASRVNGKNGEFGEIDFPNIERVCFLEPREREGSQATYGTILLRNPSGLLFLDRAEPREDGELDIPFYSFDDKKLYMTATFGKTFFDEPQLVDGESKDVRNGLCNQCFTEYQPTTTDFVLCGGGKNIRHNKTDILNNSINNYIGVIKMKVVADSEVRRETDANT